MTTAAAPHLYTSAVEAVLADALDTGNPVLSSEKHLGRHFTLTDDGYFWGRYAVQATRGPQPQAYRTAKGDEIAAVFCSLLFEQQPEAVAGFKNEHMSLHAYYHGVAPVSTALHAVFDGAKRLHRVQGVRFQYDGLYDHMHLATVWDADETEYQVWFDEELNLTEVRELRVGARLVWPAC
jgi:hypothetical protein